ncbi:hypothetical protein BT93_H0399 [Corymbia citriodora subsp. variegata]|nr:hypothetical protein BT93_H0399 [Corymbia citriodora subsp. variegata]
MAEKEGGIVKKGHEEGIKMAVSILAEFELPLGLLPIAEVVEVGFVRSTGYMWIVQKKKVEHSFKMVSKLVSYDTDITGYVEKKRIKKLKGVKAKELMLWPPVSESPLTTHQPGKSTSRALPASPRPSRSRHSLPSSEDRLEFQRLSCVTQLIVIEEERAKHVPMGGHIFPITVSSSVFVVFCLFFLSRTLISVCHDFA